MLKPLGIMVLGVLLAGCGPHSSYNIGTDRSEEPAGSYAGATLNSPVTDQNPHVGGDSSYPSSVSDQGRLPSPPEKQ